LRYALTYLGEAIVNALELIYINSLMFMWQDSGRWCSL